MYEGYHYTYYHSILRGYLQKKDFRRAEKILIDLLPIIEKSCLQSRNIYVWDYYQMLASIYYRLQENFNEYLVIERYLNLMTMLKGMPHSEALQRWPQLQHLISQSPLVINTINQQNPLLMQSVPKILHLPSSIAQRDAYPYSLKPTIINQGGSDIQSSIKWTPCLTIMMVVLGILICIACRLSFL
ncbi:hypothetical protein [Herpetosiphon giganteus]|uniref:hypothetical protein n=1 Tax=Herpetosiphon giganteus TaxID=2029754 RepID=UPI00195D95C4|nr:hypothetical protein [Herpetosiphon giganteus]MBM7846647.1 hypothetical protein [Herpetosiphon giganteus]